MGTSRWKLEKNKKNEHGENRDGDKTDTETGEEKQRNRHQTETKTREENQRPKRTPEKYGRIKKIATCYRAEALGWMKTCCG